MAVARTFEGIGIALDSLRANKVRAALTILGVAIGVMVVIAMASAITGINRSVTQQLETLGPKTFFVFRFFREGINFSDGSDELSPWRRNPWLKVEEAELLRQLPGIQSVNWEEDTNGPVGYTGTDLSSVQVKGLSTDWLLTAGGTIVEGRTWTEMEYAANTPVVVLNDKLAQQLFPGLDPLGRHIKVFGAPFEVIGIYAEPKSLFGDSDEPLVHMPHSTFAKVADYWKGWMNFSVIPDSATSVTDAQDRVTAALRVHRGLKPAQANNFSLVTQDKLLESFNSITKWFFVAMLALSSVGLMVGGVGVVAIMMISVTERTREIGVRKALGATRSEIMFQFLVEAATLTLVGCVAGMFLGGAIAFALRSLTPIPAAVPLWSVVGAILASTVTGILFGLYPASKASRMDPVEALRYE